MVKKFQIVLVRHGETSYNKMRIVQGHMDVPLNDVGKLQAEEAGKLLSNKMFSFVYSSDLQRASLTCELLLSKNLSVSAEGKKLPAIIHDAQLRERTFGCMEGKSVSEMVNAAKQANKSMIHYVAEGGETLEEFKGRAKKFFVSLCDKIEHELSSTNDRSEDVTVLLVTHGGFIKALFSVWIDDFNCNDSDENNKSYNVIVSNASHSCVTVNLSDSNLVVGDSANKSRSVFCTLFNVKPQVS